MDKKIGILLIHGYGGTCENMRPLKDFLEDKGFYVYCPTLRGHNAKPEDLLYVKYTDWIQDVETAYQNMEAECSNLFVCGLSMGGLLALILASRHKVESVITLAPSIFVKRFIFKFAPIAFLFPKIMTPVGKSPDDPDIEGYKLVPAISGYNLYLLIKYTKGILGDIKMPVLIIQGGKDGMVLSPIPYLKKHISSPHIKDLYVKNAPHILTMVKESPLIFEKIYNFMQECENGKHF